eukprot:EG_transcript_9938
MPSSDPDENPLDLVVRTMLPRWFGAHLRSADGLTLLRAATACCCSLDPWLRAGVGPGSCTARFLWTDGQTVPLDQPEALAPLALSLAKRRLNVLGLAVAAAVFGAAYAELGPAACHDCQVSEYLMSQELLRLVAQLLAIGPHDLALGHVASPEVLQARYPVLRQADLTAVLPFGRLAVIRPTDTKLRGGCRVVLQGALEEVRQLCGSMYHDNAIQDWITDWDTQLQATMVPMERDGLASVAFAELDHITLASLEGITDWANPHHVWQQLQELPPFIFIGVVGFQHNLQVPNQALHSWQRAGMRLFLASPFSFRATHAFAQNVGLLAEGSLVVDGRDMDRATEQEWDGWVASPAPVVLAGATGPRRAALAARLAQHPGVLALSRGFAPPPGPDRLAVVFAAIDGDIGSLDLKVQDGQLSTLSAAWRAVQVYAML